MSSGKMRHYVYSEVPPMVVRVSKKGRSVAAAVAVKYAEAQWPGKKFVPVEPGHHSWPRNSRTQRGTVVEVVE